MIDFSIVRSRQATIQDLANSFTPDALKAETQALYAHLLAQLAGRPDAAITLTPSDPAANDPYASDPAEVHMPWSLGHVIVHINASMEESAFLAAEMARGVENHGRSRFETPWRSVTTAAQCQALLQQSLRMCLASLEMWPEPPHYEVRYNPWKGAAEIDARGRYLSGIKHADDHLGQVADILRQAGALENAAF